MQLGRKQLIRNFMIWMMTNRNRTIVQMDQVIWQTRIVLQQRGFHPEQYLQLLIMDPILLQIYLIVFQQLVRISFGCFGSENWFAYVANVLLQKTGSENWFGYVSEVLLQKTGSEDWFGKLVWNWFERAM